MFQNKQLIFKILKTTGLGSCCVVVIGGLLLLSMYLGSVITIRRMSNGELMADKYVMRMASPSENGTEIDKPFNRTLVRDNGASKLSPAFTAIMTETFYNRQNKSNRYTNQKRSKAENSKNCKPLPPRPNCTKCENISDRKCFEYIWEMNHKKEILEYDKCNNANRVSVVGGTKTSNEEFPHMAALGYALITGKYKFMCGGSLISDKFVLTAGHCTYAVDREIPKILKDSRPSIVRLGSENINDDIRDENRRDIVIGDIIKHPKYNSPKAYHDIALLKLNKSVTFTAHIHPACVSSIFQPPTIHKLNVTGWGAIDSYKNIMSDQLQVGTVDIIQHYKCVERARPLYNRKFPTLRDHQLCAGSESGRTDTCRGDSGGPIQVRINTTRGSMHNVIGVTSQGPKKCAALQTTGIYIRVQSVIKWIEDVVWLKNYGG